jgi:hypothetical protein
VGSRRTTITNYFVDGTKNLIYSTKLSLVGQENRGIKLGDLIDIRNLEDHILLGGVNKSTIL